MLSSMHRYAAFLGIHPNLSIAELAAVLPDFQKGPLSGQLLMFSTAQELDQKFLNRLGGTVLIAKQITSNAVTLDDVPALLGAELKGVKGKAVFALRFTGVSPNRAKNLYRACKDKLKQQGNSSRYVGSERDPAKAIQLHDEGLLDPKSGAELLIMQPQKTAEKNSQDTEAMWIGRTVAAQDVKAYTLRDMEKPVRDTTVGLLPPKLAQMLLNFGTFVAGKEKGVTVFDPFCGTGVIPIEALLLGWNVLASDLSLKAVNGCEKNIEWTRKTYKIAKKDVESTVWKQDATKAFELKEKPDMIVTEGTLGPPLTDRATVKDAETHCKQAEDIVGRFLTNCAETLPGVPVVMILPVWYAQKKIIHLQKVWDVITKLKYRATLPPHTDPSTEGRFSLLYRRTDQFVGREIVLLKPAK